ncbi:serine/threonine protein phosphatase [Rhizobium sp. 'Codium 1']|uniref:serine/threonine protein phosphatase n=1 Tax=Rhizobium sp. 'Codium 1' TaxID=2940484 RepID=UPI001E3A6494|nr:serine/threonine protein phosphatase [Rhizobium sp. 'Codium 1']MCC8931768.1 serine/threonine protein phosphatase [Rhizobium sp. 'Codium 1']
MAYLGDGSDTPNGEIELADDEIAEVLRALVQSDDRVQCLDLPHRRLWIKRQGVKVLPRFVSFQGLVAALLRVPHLRPSPQLAPDAMQAREIARMHIFAAAGFPVPPIVFQSKTAMVMADVGPTLAERLNTLRTSDPVGHDALLVQAADGLGRVHAAGLSHGRPHVRDFFLSDGEVGFMDFEEDPASVMPLEMAQARDVFLYFLIVASRAIRPDETCPAALGAWSRHATDAAQRELRSLTALASRILPLIRLIGRVHMGSDLRRFIMATEFLMKAPLDRVESPNTAKAGQDG